MEYGDAALAQEIILWDYCHLLGISFLYWDHLITLDTEVHHLWRRRKTTSAYWFFINRYLGFISNIPIIILPFSKLSPQLCRRYTFLREILLLATQVVVSLIMLLRVYALYSRSLRVVWLLLAIGTGTIGLTVWSMNGQEMSPSSLGGCHVEVSQSTARRLAIPWEGLFAFDATIFGLTVFNAHATTRRMGPLANMPLHRVIVRDGALYFGIMALANLSNIGTFYLGGPLFRGSFATFASCISVTMMSRLMLNLHGQADVGILSRMPNLSISRDDMPLEGLSDYADTHIHELPAPDLDVVHSRLGEGLEINNV
ncbi:hypothetical protein DFH09DRAFT_1145465 [Mycena vulgaris]|nr:hypothetical protein DFH09DRAFT_1145465 [Mycena vulgaris]